MSTAAPSYTDQVIDQVEKVLTGRRSLLKELVKLEALIGDGQTAMPEGVAELQRELEEVKGDVTLTRSRAEAAERERDEARGLHTGAAECVEHLNEATVALEKEVATLKDAAEKLRMAKFAAEDRTRRYEQDEARLVAQLEEVSADRDSLKRLLGAALTPSAPDLVTSAPGSQMDVAGVLLPVAEVEAEGILEEDLIEVPQSAPLERGSRPPATSLAGRVLAYLKTLAPQGAGTIAIALEMGAPKGSTSAVLSMLRDRRGLILGGNGEPWRFVSAPSPVLEEEDEDDAAEDEDEDLEAATATADVDVDVGVDPTDEEKELLEPATRPRPSAHGRGDLVSSILAHFASHPRQNFGPPEVADAIGRAKPATRAALARLADKKLLHHAGVGMYKLGKEQKRAVAPPPPPPAPPAPPTAPPPRPTYISQKTIRESETRDASRLRVSSGTDDPARSGRAPVKAIPGPSTRGAGNVVDF